MRLWIALALTLFAGLAEAQVSSVADNDMRAAYCLESDDRLITYWRSSGLEAIINEAAKDPRAAAQANALKAQMATLEDQRGRLAAYVRVRLLNGADMFGIFAAMQRAQVDFEASKTPGPSHDAAVARSRGCNDLDWLPF